MEENEGQEVKWIYVEQVFSANSGLVLVFALWMMIADKHSLFVLEVM